jgi:hypothetical protein
MGGLSTEKSHGNCRGEATSGWSWQVIAVSGAGLHKIDELITINLF